MTRVDTLSILLLGLACVGATDAIYLATRRLKKQPPVCSARKSCSIVLDSPYRKTFGIDNDRLGLLFYATIALITGLIMAISEARPMLWIALAVIVILGVLVSIYYVYIQWHRIKAWCWYCLLSAAVVFSMASLVVNQLVTGHLV